MRKILSILILSLILTSYLPAQDSNEEWRATWVITWEMFGGASTVDAKKAKIRSILDDHKAANMNAVLWQVRQSGTAYYTSSYEPWGSYVGSAYPGFDPLTYAIEQAHLRGMELHAWFNAFHASSTRAGTPAGDNPDWVCRDGYGNPMPSSRALSPGMEAVRDYTLDVAMEIVNNYDIDGLHLDYIRWNEYNTSSWTTSLAKNTQDYYPPLDGHYIPEDITPTAVANPDRYLYDVEHPYSGGVPTGYASWEDYWRDSVTKFVVTLHDSIQAVKPWVRLSPAALGKYNWSSWQGYGYVYQDAGLWFNEGHIDQLTPMHYHWTNTLTFNDALAQWGTNLTQGISEGNLFTAGPGSYQFESQGVWNNHPSVIEGARNFAWMDGFQFFSWGSWENRDYWNFASETFFARKTKVRNTGRILDVVPDSPTLALNQVDSMTVELTVTPPAGLAKDQWFAIYRETTDTLEQDQATLLDIHFGQTAYSFTDVFDGYQDYGGQFYYAATMLDRYWNESANSAVLASDHIPSFAPEILSFWPSDGDTMRVTDKITIDFSKRMNRASVESAISFNPQIAMSQYKWSDQDHRLVLFVDGNYEYGTEYTINIAASAVDVNGAALDANGDGIPGDGFTSTFSTVDVDLIGPELLSSLPSIEISNQNIDIHANFSFRFDELLDPATVNNTNITLWSDGTEVISDPAHSDNGSRSIIDVRAKNLLEPGMSYEIHLSNAITDTSGNAFGSHVYGPFTTEQMMYSEVNLIDDFRGTLGEWQRPSYSGSTVGLREPTATTNVFDYTNDVYLPASYKYFSYRKSAFLKYHWDVDAPEHLLRDYLSGGDARSVVFDKNNLLQVFVYGDNSGTLLRIALDEKTSSGIWSFHEVTTWVTINWEGWKLVEWDLSDPNIAGEWGGLGNSALDGAGYRIDSFQLTYDPVNGDSLGMIYFDDLRVAKKQSTVSRDAVKQIPDEMVLHQNFPNPFNPDTRISYTIPRPMRVDLSVYNVRGQEVQQLVNEHQIAGNHELNFHGSELPTGVYLLRLSTEEGSQTRRMLLIK
ncbi:MAG: family 10 glycosylhydrolase [Candidatus Marinimicrobia bacterium]|nr:family 10 glycosylhydrolase [Candidatus Neomarinimicrobiota bacterium]MCF7851075.1 family 10 glycosylhydrolase [Candidatus Neomarinimicrobiota bacterium]